MHISIEIQLTALIAAIYIYDSAQLLFSNEAIVHRIGQERRVILTRDYAALGRRLMVLLPLLYPMFPAHRLSWDAAAKKNDITAADFYSQLESADLALSLTLAPTVVFVALGIFLGVPFALQFLTTMGFLVTVAAIYVGIVFLLVKVWRVRDVCGISKAKFWSLAFESIACPPCAVNLLRKASLLVVPRLDLIDFVEIALPSHQQQDVVRHVLRRVEDDLIAEEPESARAQVLRDYGAGLRSRFGLESDAANATSEAVTVQEPKPEGNEGLSLQDSLTGAELVSPPLESSGEDASEKVVTAQEMQLANVDDSPREDSASDADPVAATNDVKEKV